MIIIAIILGLFGLSIAAIFEDSPRSKILVSAVALFALIGGSYLVHLDITAPWIEVKRELVLASMIPISEGYIVMSTSSTVYKVDYIGASFLSFRKLTKYVISFQPTPDPALEKKPPKKKK